MNILHVSSAISWRGGEQQIANLLKGLRNFPTISSHVFCAQGSAFHTFCEENSIGCTAYRKTSGFSLSIANQLKKCCHENQIDLIHIHDSHAHTYTFIAGLLLGCTQPVVIHRRVAFKNKSILSKLKYNYKRIKDIICISYEVKQQVQSFSSKQTTVVYSSIDIEEIKSKPKISIRHQLNLLDDSILVGNISALTPNKDYITFLMVAKSLIDQNVNYHFVILGTGSMKEKLIRFSKKLKINTHIHFLGFQSEAVSYLKDFDVFLMTSKNEGLGTAVLESFTCRVPVVSSNGGGLKETVLHEKTGMSCEVEDVNCLSNSVLRLSNDIALREHIIDNAYKMVSEKFSILAMTKEVVSIYEKYLSIPLRQ